MKRPGRVICVTVGFPKKKIFLDNASLNKARKKSNKINDIHQINPSIS